MLRSDAGRRRCVCESVFHFVNAVRLVRSSNVHAAHIPSSIHSIAGLAESIRDSSRYRARVKARKAEADTVGAPS